MKKIFDLTLSFQMEFLERYDILLETPLVLNHENKSITKIKFEEYYIFLNVQLGFSRTQRALVENFWDLFKAMGVSLKMEEGRRFQPAHSLFVMGEFCDRAQSLPVVPE